MLLIEQAMVFSLSPCKIWSARQAAGTYENIIMHLQFQLSQSMASFIIFPPQGIMFWKIVSTKQTVFIK